jgi:hypothetical protein
VSEVQGGWEIVGSRFGDRQLLSVADPLAVAV